MLGWTTPRCKSIIIGTTYSKRAIGRVITHEIGHVFGAEHSTDPNSVMFENVAMITSLMFDEGNRKVIQENIKKL
jgi:predicted Zn-dependent protease